MESKNPAIVARYSGTVAEVKNENGERSIIVLSDKSETKKDSMEYAVLPRRIPIVKVGEAVGAFARARVAVLGVHGHLQ